MNGWITGIGPTGGGGTMAEADSGAFEVTVVDPPPIPEGPGLGMNTGNGDLPFMVLL